MPQSIGRYTVLRQLGEGSAGVVLAAYDPVLDRRVALKLVRQELVSGDSANPAFARLQREAQAMAQFSHPNVAMVFDVGQAGGQIYVAMEYVERDLLAWLQEKPRSWHTIVAMFLQAGRGLARAHAVGLIHRDFKPANVLVGNEERARVSDFGLVASVQSSTKVKAGLGTPAYMAPEQHAGGSIDARADQFAFCVALYEALYERRPFAGGSVEAVRRNVLHGAVIAPPADSDVPAWLWPVIARGLATSPAERYERMADLIDALDNDPERAKRRLTALDALLHFGQQRVDAGDAGTGEVVLRQALANAAGTGDHQRMAQAQVLLAHVLGIVSGQVEEAQAGLDDAEALLAQLAAPMPQLTARLHETRGSLLRLQMRPDEALSSYQRAIEGYVEAGGSDHPRVALAIANKAAVCTELLRFNDARAHFDESLEILSRTAGGTLLEEATIRSAYAPALLSSGDPHAALAQTERALKLRQEALGETHALVGQELNNAGILLQAVGRYEEAMRYLERSLEIAQRQLSPTDPSVANALNNIGNLKHSLGDYDGSLVDLQKALALREALLGPDHLDNAGILTNIGVVLYDRADLDSALRYHERALALNTRELGPEHPVVANAFANVAGVLLQLGRVPEAVAGYRRAIASLESATGTRHPDVACALGNLGAALQQGESPDYQGSRDALDRARSIYEDILGPAHVDVARILTHLGDLEALQGAHAAAKSHFEGALPIYAAVYGDAHTRTGAVLLSLGNASVKSGHPAMGLEHLRRALVICDDSGIDAHQRAVIEVSVAVALWNTGDKDEALRVANEAVRTFFSVGDELNRAATGAWIDARRSEMVDDLSS